MSVYSSNKVLITNSTRIWYNITYLTVQRLEFIRSLKCFDIVVTFLLLSFCYGIHLIGAQCGMLAPIPLVLIFLSVQFDHIVFICRSWACRYQKWLIVWKTWLIIAEKQERDLWVSLMSNFFPSKLLPLRICHIDGLPLRLNVMSECWMKEMKWGTLNLFMVGLLFYQTNAFIVRFYGGD